MKNVKFINENKNIVFLCLEYFNITSDDFINNHVKIINDFSKLINTTLKTKINILLEIQSNKFNLIDNKTDSFFYQEAINNIFGNIQDKNLLLKLYKFNVLSMSENIFLYLFNDYNLLNKINNELLTEYERIRKEFYN